MFRFAKRLVMLVICLPDVLVFVFKIRNNHRKQISVIGNSHFAIDPSVFGKISHGVVLLGPPSTGRTYFARDCAQGQAAALQDLQASLSLMAMYFETNKIEQSWLDQEPGATFLTYRTGFRTWGICRDGDKFVLASMGGPLIETWPACEKLTARCLAGMIHAAPFPTCKCGIHAVDTKEYIKNSKNNVIRRTFLGEVKLWGNVLEYSDGVRAEFAYPISILEARCNACNNYIDLKKMSYYYSPEYERGVIAFCAEDDNDVIRDPDYGFKKLDPSFLAQIAEDYGITIG